MSVEPVATGLSDGTTQTVHIYPDGTTVTILPDGTIETQSLITVTSQESTPPISRAPLPTTETDVMTVTRYDTSGLNWNSEPSTVRQAPSQRPTALYPNLPTYAETSPPSYDIAAAMPSPSHGRRSVASPSAPPPDPLNQSLLPPSAAQNKGN